MSNHHVPCPDGQAYTVQCGDTLASIAAQYGVTVKQLLASNPFLTCQPALIAGQTIWIPLEEEE